MLPEGDHFFYLHLVYSQSIIQSHLLYLCPLYTCEMIWEILNFVAAFGKISHFEFFLV